VSFAGAGVLIMLAPMIREKPVAIAKNETREERSRMVGKEDKSTLQHEPCPARGKKFPFTRLAGS
jgi:hypothetical protein